jgi:hypothetical protein
LARLRRRYLQPQADLARQPRFAICAFVAIFAVDSRFFIMYRPSVPNPGAGRRHGESGNRLWTGWAGNALARSLHGR